MKQSNQPTCPKCAAAIPEEAPGGLCPKCALEGVSSVPSTNAGRGSTPPPAIGEIAPHFPELEILELIGAGGMGAVYKARQPQLDRFVALKILSHDLAGDPSFVERFNREAKVLARLSHPNIVGIHDFGTAGPYCYLTMEYVDGVNLRQAMRAGRFAPTEALAMVQHLCSALKFAHEEGILHRDIKPENILIDSKGRVKIADFGIAKLVGDDRQHDFTLTMQGSVLGSPHYMAPEQIETPGDVDQRADIYSLGVVLYEMLTGGLPIGRFALPSEKAAMDARIDHIVLRTLEKEREARYQSAGEVGTEVAALATGQVPVLPVATTATNSGNSGTARFSVWSAILTGISLVLVPLFGWFYVEIFREAFNSPASAGPAGLAVSISSKVPGMLLIALMILLSAGTAITGFILGLVAMSDVRKSGGRKSGLGFAIFAVVAWPFAFMAALFLLSIRMTPIGSSIAFLLVGIAVPLASFILIRGLRRWARGVERKDGQRHFPSFGRTILPVVITILVGPLLNIVAWNYLPPALRSGLPQGRPAESVDWRLGEAELSLNMRVLSNIRAEFYLVMKNSKGEPVKYSKIGVCEAESGQQSRNDFIVKIGTLGSGAGEGGFAGHLSLTGESGEILGVQDIEKWRVASFEDVSELYGGRSTYGMGHLNGTTSIRVGERHEMIDGTSELTGTLELETRAIWNH